MTDSTCATCRRWVARTWEQYEVRKQNMLSAPHVKAYQCPECGSNDWATTLPINDSRLDARETAKSPTLWERFKNWWSMR